MPIANCFVNKTSKDHYDLESLVDEWASMLNIKMEDITLNLINDFRQAGKSYSVMINLFLPSVWKEDDIVKIQRTLSELFAKYLNIDQSDIFIITTIVQSGNVVSNGKIETW